VNAIQFLDRHRDTNFGPSRVAANRRVKNDRAWSVSGSCLPVNEWEVKILFENSIRKRWQTEGARNILCGVGTQSHQERDHDAIEAGQSPGYVIQSRILVNKGKLDASMIPV
jgi:hypothetical protein